MSPLLEIAFKVFSNQEEALRAEKSCQVKYMATINITSLPFQSVL
jgi:hypothetical protein